MTSRMVSARMSCSLRFRKFPLLPPSCMAGQGTYTSAEGTYKGEWHEGSAHGRGILTWTNGDRYNGSWEDGQKSGKGVYIESWRDSPKKENKNKRPI
jgi:hypothetical protein